MEELKKAYAQMILTTAKEAAARVMAAELRNQRLKEDLDSTTGEAARMLTRLKQMIDSQIQKEGEKLMTQQRKRDELESQLNEAEGIILALRGELNKAKVQLDESKVEELLSQRRSRNEVCNRVSEAHTLVTPSTSILKLDPVDGNNSYWDQGGFARTPSDPDISRIQIVDVAGTTTELEEKILNGKKETVSPLRRSLRKRKPKCYENIIALFGLHRSHQSKRSRQIFPLVACSNSSKVKYGEDRSQAEGESQIQKNPGTVKCQVVQQDDVAAPVELTPSRVESVAKVGNASKSGDGADTNPSDFARLKCKKMPMNNTDELSLSGECPSEIENADSSIHLMQIAQQLLSLSGGDNKLAQTAQDI